MAEKPCVLFVCTNNAARSQMAEALPRHKAGCWFDVASAGWSPPRSIPSRGRYLEKSALIPAASTRRARESSWDDGPCVTRSSCVQARRGEVSPRFHIRHADDLLALR
jgi:hypothetical protein